MSPEDIVRDSLVDPEAVHVVDEVVSTKLFENSEDGVVVRVPNCGEDGNVVGSGDFGLSGFSAICENMWCRFFEVYK